MHQCIAMQSISIHVLVQQNEYRFINVLIYCCVLINELFSAMDKTEIDILQKTVERREKTLYNMMMVMGLYLRKLSYCFQLANNHLFAKASNTFKQ